MVPRKLPLLLCAALLAASAAAQTATSPGEARAAATMERLRSSPSLLAAFLRAMPKGGDLDRGAGLGLGQQVGWDDDFERMRQKVEAGGEAAIVASGRKFIDEFEADMRRALHCDVAARQVRAGEREVLPDPGCSTTVR